MTDTSQAVAKAKEEVFALCKGKKWTMRIPVQPDDSDIVIMAGLDALSPLPPPSATDAERIIQRAIETEPGRGQTITVERSMLCGLIAQALDARSADHKYAELERLTAHTVHLEQESRHWRDQSDGWQSKYGRMEQEIARLTKEAEEFKRDMGL